MIVVFRFHFKLPSGGQKLNVSDLASGGGALPLAGLKPFQNRFGGLGGRFLGEKALQADVLIQVRPMNAGAPADETVVSALGHGRELEAGVEPDRDDEHLAVLQVDTHEVCLKGDAADSQGEVILRQSAHADGRL